MKNFLDTDICIAILRGKEPELESKLMNFSLSLVEIPSVVAAELWLGVKKSTQPSLAQAKLEAFLRHLTIASFDESAARKYGEIRATLEKRGLRIGANDLLIAASVLVQGGQLITRNKKEYERVPGLQIKVW